MKWIEAKQRLPKEHTWVIFQWEDTKNVFREKPFNLRDENGNIGGLVLLKWLEEIPNEAGYWEKRGKAAETLLKKNYKNIPDSPEFMDWQNTIEGERR